MSGKCEPGFHRLRLHRIAINIAQTSCMPNRLVTMATKYRVITFCIKTRALIDAAESTVNSMSGCHGDGPARHAGRLSEIDCKSVQPQPVKLRRAFPTHIVLVQITTRPPVAMVTGRNQSGHFSTRNGNRHHLWRSNGHIGIDESHCCHPPGAGDDRCHGYHPSRPVTENPSTASTQRCCLPEHKFTGPPPPFDSAALSVACIVFTASNLLFCRPASIILGFAIATKTSLLHHFLFLGTLFLAAVT